MKWLFFNFTDSFLGNRVLVLILNTTNFDCNIEMSSESLLDMDVKPRVESMHTIALLPFSGCRPMISYSVTVTFDYDIGKGDYYYFWGVIRRLGN